MLTFGIESLIGSKLYGFSTDRSGVTAKLNDGKTLHMSILLSLVTNSPSFGRPYMKLVLGMLCAVKFSEI